MYVSMNKLKNCLLMIVLLISQFSIAQTYDGTRAIAKRQFPWLAEKMQLKKKDKENGKDIFELSVSNEKLIIEASSESAASRGLDWYVKHYCHQSISHMGDNKNMIKTLPQIKGMIKKTSFVPYRYALNYCTINYSFSFYTWEDWEKELDWMALNGVNIMLAPMGTEMVWYNTLLKLGYTDAEAKAFIPGPAYTAWWLMGNLEGWGGPVSMDLMQQQVQLQQKILVRMKELGIQPILQGFYGMVPHDLAKKVTDARVIDQGKWVFTEFTRPGILIPTNREFERIADIYYAEIKKLYGSDIHYFGGEPFHEGGKSAGVDVTQVAKAIQTQMQKNFPNSTWVLQGWQNNPSDKILTGLKKENTLIIELFGENTNNWEKRKGYDGTSFIWSNVSNFGEKNGLYGRLQRFVDEVFRAKESQYGTSLRGVGVIPEGINNNPVAYDLMLDLAWYDEKPDLDKWIEAYTRYRYGKYNKSIVLAWKEFVQTVYNSPVDEKGNPLYQEGPSESIYCARPSIKVNPVSSWGTRKRYYDTDRFKKAVGVFVNADKEFRNSETYQADKTDFLRQVLADKGDLLYKELVEAIESKNKQSIASKGDQFLTMILLQDSLLNNNLYFSLDRWINQAQSFGKNLPDAKNVLYNAKSQITYWGPDYNSSTTLRDYAHKEWGGLLGSLYYQRWKLFINEALKGNLVAAKTFYDMEVNWSAQGNHYPMVKLKNNALQELQKRVLK